MQNQPTLPTLSSYLLTARDRDPQLPAVRFKRNNIWQKLGWAEYFERICEVGSLLIDLGVEPGDRVGIFASTRLEWALCDFATIGCGAITVPIYHTVTPEDFEHIVNNAEVKVLFIEDESLLKIYKQVAERCPSVEKVILFSSRSEQGELPVLSARVRDRKRESDKARQQRDQFIQRLKAAQASDVTTIVYTSGTTGLPKGVVLTHTQAVSEVTEAFSYVGVDPTDLSLSFLPFSHVLGRVELWGHLANGFTLGFAESIEKIQANLRELRPTLLVSVPRIFEKIHLKIQTQAESNRISKSLFSWAIGVGRKVGDLRLQHKPIPLTLIPEYEIANRLVLSKVREALGGRLRFAISGGAPLNREVALFFHACGVLVLEGYGLTETTAAVTVNTPFDYAFGSVGKPFGDVTIRFAEDGEILIKSNKVMRSYYKDDEATRRVLEDGWFATGDIGHLTEYGHLKITDRKKDLIKTDGGKYVAPQKIEALLKSSPFVSQVHIHGDQRKFVVALVTLERDYAKKFAEQRGISYPSYAALAQHPAITEAVRKVVAEANAKLSSYETVKRFLILPDEFSIENGELTPSLKIKRKVIDQKFKRELDSLYS